MPGNWYQSYSYELEQEALIPCAKIFKAEVDIMKVKHLIQLAPTTSTLPPKKESKSCKDTVGAEEYSKEMVWLSFEGYSLKMDEKSCLVDNNKRLSDLYINFGQKMMKMQFPSIDGFNNMLLQSKVPSTKITVGLQVIHDRGDHWILAFTVQCPLGGVEIYDS